MKNDIVVVKFGSELVSNSKGVDQRKINLYAKGLVNIHKPSQLIVVTSGAVKIGLSRVINTSHKKQDLSDVTLSQLGAASIISAWERAFDKVGVLCGGLLVTHNELKDSEEGPQFVKALKSALKSDVVSVVNENDALSDTELMKLAVGGDNDGLAAHIAKQVGASKLVLFTSQGGIYDNNDKLVTLVDKSNRANILNMLELRSKTTISNSSGRGGITSKFQAACQAVDSGIIAEIAKPSTDMNGEFKTKFMLG